MYFQYDNPIGVNALKGARALWLLAAFFLLPADWAVAASPAFSPEEAKEFTQDLMGHSANDKVDGSRAYLAAQEFRSILAINARRVENPPFAAVAGVFDDLKNSPPYKNYANAWSYFFSTTVPFVGRPSNGNVVIGYYAPMLDTIALTQWRIDDGLFELEIVEMRDGAAFRKENPRANVPLISPVSVSTNYTKTFELFNSRYSDPKKFTPLRGNASVHPYTVAGRRAVLGVSLVLAAFVSDDPLGVADLYNSLMAAIAASDLQAMKALIPITNVVSSQVLAGFPPDIIRNMAPVLLQFSESGVIVYSQSREYPTYFAATEFFLAAGREPEVETHTIFELKSGF